MSMVNALELSTLHVSDETIKLLDRMAKDNYSWGMNVHGVFVFDHGWFIFVQDSVDWQHNDLNVIMKYAVDKNCRYIVLDVHAPMCDDLPIMKRTDD